MREKIIIKRRLPSWISRVQRRARYLVMTMKGIKFTKKFYRAEHVPANLTRFYQLLLKLIRMKGIMPVGFAQRLGFSYLCIGMATSRGYVKITGVPVRPPKDVQEEIAKMIGEAPR